jgi:hypothetical protein
MLIGADLECRKSVGVMEIDECYHMHHVAWL